MFCLVTHIVSSNLKSKNQEVSGFSDQWVLNAMVDFNEIKIIAYQHFYFKHQNFQEIWKSQTLKIFTFKKKCHYFCTGVCMMAPVPWWYLVVCQYDRLVSLFFRESADFRTDAHRTPAGHQPSATRFHGRILVHIGTDVVQFPCNCHADIVRCQWASCQIGKIAGYACAGNAMMASSNGNIFRVTGHLRGEFTGQQWIPRTKASDAKLWCLPWYAPE